MIERIVKHQGNWKINLNDVDPWPSNPHGDRIDAPEKLDLLTGLVYSKQSKNRIRVLSKKSMRYIFYQIKAFEDKRLYNKLNSQMSHVTYF